MRSVFSEFYVHSEEEILNLWNSAVVVFDTNILLDIYKYERKLRNKWLKIFELLKAEDQLWMPYQVGLEFHRNRPGIIMDLQKGPEKIKAALQEAGKTITDGFTQVGPLPTVNTDSIVQDINSIMSSAVRRLDSGGKRFAITSHSDEIRNQLDEIFDGLVGMPLSASEISELEKDGPKRYSRLIPPGFGDIKKGDGKGPCTFGIEGQFGDLAIWSEILKRVKSERVSVIFVTNDVTKGDWIWLAGSAKMKYGTHPALRKEIADAATDADVYICSGERCLEVLDDKYGLKTSEKQWVEIRESNQARWAKQVRGDYLHPPRIISVRVDDLIQEIANLSSVRAQIVHNSVERTKSIGSLDHSQMVENIATIESTISALKEELTVLCSRYPGSFAVPMDE